MDGGGKSHVQLQGWFHLPSSLHHAQAALLTQVMEQHELLMQTVGMQTQKQSLFFSFFFHIYSYIMPCLLQPECSSMHIFRSEAMSCCHWILFQSASSSWSISAWISELTVKFCVQFHLLLSGIMFPSTVLYNKKWMQGICHRGIRLYDHTLKEALVTTTSVSEVCSTLDVSYQMLLLNPSFLLQTRQVEGTEAVTVLWRKIQLAQL